jgi:hypoxanthine phosphoribosyltransferase
MENLFPELPEAQHISEVLITPAQLQARLQAMGAAVSRAYAGRELILVGLLKGTLCFMADLLRAITIPVTVDFLAISGYGPDARGHGEVRLLKDLEASVQGKHVLFVEDIVDTGLSINYLLRHIRAQNPASLEVCVLLDRPHRRLVPLDMCFVGFEIPDVWVVGYGLDYREYFRNLPYIAIFNPPNRGAGSAPPGEVIIPTLYDNDKAPPVK